MHLWLKSCGKIPTMRIQIGILLTAVTGLCCGCAQQPPPSASPAHLAMPAYVPPATLPRGVGQATAIHLSISDLRKPTTVQVELDMNSPLGVASLLRQSAYDAVHVKDDPPPSGWVPVMRETSPEAANYARQVLTTTLETEGYVVAPTSPIELDVQLLDWAATVLNKARSLTDMTAPGAWWTFSQPTEVRVMHGQTQAAYLRVDGRGLGKDVSRAYADAIADALNTALQNPAITEALRKPVSVYGPAR